MPSVRVYLFFVLFSFGVGGGVSLALLPHVVVFLGLLQVVLLCNNCNN